jgi:hypothetical protein
LPFYSKAVLHPYYKLDYIKLSWGGAKEQEEERENGNLDAKNWQDEACKILETTVRFKFILYKNMIRTPSQTYTDGKIL